MMEPTHRRPDAAYARSSVLADLGQDRPQGMWTHHPAVALLAEAHVRTLD
jgi:hypothetical protein